MTLTDIKKIFHVHKWEFKHHPLGSQDFGTVYICKCGKHLFVTRNGAKKVLE